MLYQFAKRFLPGVHFDHLNARYDLVHHPDAHVGRELFDQCMKGYLRHELVILVTHQLQFLEQADLIVIMDKGKISAMGTYEAMQRSGLDFAQLLSDPNVNEHMMDDHESDAGDALDHNSMTSRKRCISTSRQTSRTDSFMSLSSMADSITLDAPMSPQETRVEGKIGLGLYKEYFAAGSGWLLICSLLLLCIGTQVVISCSDVFLSYW